MDWIERLLHISPDGGNGYFEYLILALAALAVVYPLRYRIRRVLRAPIVSLVRIAFRLGAQPGRAERRSSREGPRSSPS